MKHEFAILPWEYRGADFDPTPHAHTSLQIAGSQRDFLLKMRDGVIYFKDPKRAPLFAIPRQFDTELRGNELISTWRTEMECGNFGRCYARPLSLQRCPGTTVVIAIIRPDFSGWISDAFHLNWHEIPVHRDGKTLNVWKDGIGYATWRAILKIRDSLRDRIMPARERQVVEPYWFLGDEVELRRIFTLIIQLYIRSNDVDFSRTWAYMATNIASTGGVDRSFGPPFSCDLRSSKSLPSLLNLLKRHFVWVSMDWIHHSKKSFHPKQWGNDWRGRYEVQTPSIELTAPLTVSISYHERLELLLQLRDWLDGKSSPRQIASWLSQALD